MPEPSSEAAPQKGPRRRRPPRRATVERIERVTPGLIRMTVAGEELAEFGTPRPGAHMKLLFPSEGSGWNHKDPDAPRPPSRTYTPLRYDAAARSLQVEFVLHGVGLASNWAERAREGDTLYLAGPGGGYDVAADCRHIVLVADETAMPAAGTILEALPPGCGVTALCEVPDAAEERLLSPSVAVTPKWLRRSRVDLAGTLLEQEVAALSVPADAYWWIACEAGAMRRIRRHIVKERGIDPRRVHTRGYWRLGETNYPDHDYGED